MNEEGAVHLREPIALMIPPFPPDVHFSKIIFHSTVLVADGTIRTVAVSA